MKWIAKRILLRSQGHMDRALTQFVSPFVERIRQKYGITDWYCSRKTDEDRTMPSVRIYLNVDEAIENELLSELGELLNRKRSVIGWTGQYNEPDPTIEPSKPNLKRIQRGCEIALKLMIAYPGANRHNTREFLVDLRQEVNAFLYSMNGEYDWEAIHFIANNLGLRDEFIIRLASVQ